MNDEFKEVKSNDLRGIALDWAIAQVLIFTGDLTADSEEHSTGKPYFNCKFGVPSVWGEGKEQKGTTNQDTGKPWVMHGPGGSFEPSSDWRDGGELLDKFCVDLTTMADGSICANLGTVGIQKYSHGATRLEAACRAVVFSYLGEKVLIPVELLS